MGRWDDRYGIPGDVDPKRQALFMNARKSLPKEISVTVADIDVYAVVTALFDLGVYGAGHNITTGQIFERVVFSHESMASFVNETSPLTTHRFRNKKVLCVGMIETGGVELNEFHVSYFCSGSVGHGYTVPCGHIRVAGVDVYFASTASAEQRISCQIGENTISLNVENVCTPAPLLALGGP
jgi:hypothetical protein